MYFLNIIDGTMISLSILQSQIFGTSQVSNPPVNVKLNKLFGIYQAEQTVLLLSNPRNCLVNAKPYKLSANAVL